MHESSPPDPPEIEDDLPDFTPVPLTRHRHDGWTPERQRGFIAALARTGVVAQAARSVGMSSASAYNLRRRPHAESFALAWDMVEDEVRNCALAFVVDQAMYGSTRPRFYRGKFVGTIHSFETRLALAAVRAAFSTPPRRGVPRGKVDE
jgi:hypothetical protein